MYTDIEGHKAALFLLSFLMLLKMSHAHSCLISEHILFKKILLFAGFQVSAWLAQLKYADTIPLSNLAAIQLMEHLGLTNYLLSTECDRVSSTYIPNTNGWNSGTL